MKYTKVVSKITITASVIVILSCCTSKKGAGGVNQERTDSIKAVVDTFIENAMKRKSAYERELKTMTIPQLVNQLASESDRGLESFNSLAYKEAVSRGKEGAQQIGQEITVPTKSSLLAILAVRKADSVFYMGMSPVLKNRVLLDALKNTNLYNKFGLPHIKWEDASLAIIAEGRNVTDSLKQLLQDARPAPVWGSEDFAEYQQYQYRVCDYAWALLLSIENRLRVIPPNPKERDKLIAEYINQKLN